MSDKYGAASVSQIFLIVTSYCVYLESIVLMPGYVIKWSEFLVTVPEVPGSSPGGTDFLRIGGPGTGSTQPREDK
jgi:hypothetical protein